MLKLELAYAKAMFSVPKDEIEKYLQNTILKNFILMEAGCYESAHGHYISREYLEEYIMIYCYSGVGYVKIGGNTWKVSSGDIVFCIDKIPHEYYSDKDEPWSILWAHFKGESVREFLGLAGINLASPTIHVGITPKISNIFHEIFNYLERGYNLYSVIYTSTLLQQIFSTILIIKMNKKINAGFDITIQKVIEYMNENIKKALTLEELSKFAGVSKFGFVRRFKSQVGYSPIEYYNRLKIQKACEMIKLTNMNISEISGALGYGNPYYFSNAFKKIIGCSPKDYKDK